MAGRCLRARGLARATCQVPLSWFGFVLGCETLVLAKGDRQIQIAFATVIQTALREAENGLGLMETISDSVISGFSGR